MVPKITRTRCFLQGYHKKYIFKIIKQNSITFLSWSSWKSNKDIFFEYFPRPKFTQCHSPWDFIYVWNESLIILCLTYSVFTRLLEFLKKPEKHSLHEKCPYSKLFWSAFSCIRTEYEQILCISLYSVRMRKNADQNNSEYGHFSRSDSPDFNYI